MVPESRSLFEQLHSGMVFEAVGPYACGFGDLVDVTPTRIDARIGPGGPIAGRALVRIPVKAALLTFSAHIATLPERGPDYVRLDSFSTATLVDRRRAERLNEPIRVAIRSGDDPSSTRVLPALNISSRGLLLGWPGTPGVVLGEHLEMTLTLSGTDHSVIGEVVRALPERTAIRFISPSDSTRAAIIAHSFQRQYETNLVDDPLSDME